MKRRLWYRKLCLRVNEANAYLIACPSTREALLVDAGEYPAELDTLLTQQDLRLRTVFLTHSHYDHVGAVGEVKARHAVQVILGRQEGRVGGIRVDRWVQSGDRVQVGEVVGAVVATSGHTPGSLSLIIGGYAFVGDALFAGAVGGTETREDFEQQVSCIRQHLFSLPDDTIVCPGHGPCTTVGVERIYNGFCGG